MNHDKLLLNYLMIILQLPVIRLFNDYSSIASEAKHEVKYWEGLKILSLKQMLQRSLICMAQVKAGNTSENLLSEIRQVIFSVSRKRND